MNIAVFCSGYGSNLQAIIAAVKRGYIRAQLRVVVSDCKGCYALARARRAGIEALFQDPRLYKSREDYDRQIVRELRKREVGLVVLAGFMRIVSPVFVRSYKNRIMNIHPSLLPAFKGTNGIKDAFEYGVKLSGPTVHFVDQELDHGPIIVQKAVAGKEGDTQAALERRIHDAEHEIYPKAIKLFAEGRLKIIGRKVKVL